jgi:hypothetical protein
MAGETNCKSHLAIARDYVDVSGLKCKGMEQLTSFRKRMIVMNTMQIMMHWCQGRVSM